MTARLRRTVRKALLASPREWLVRGRQLLSSRRLELLVALGRPGAPPAGHLDSLGVRRPALGDWFRDREGPWLVGQTRCDELRRLYRQRAVQLEGLLSRANQVVAGEMCLLGHGFIPFEGEDRWHRDPILSVVSPQRVYTRIRYMDVAEVGDGKHVWEPNRFGWAYWLGVAHVVSEDKVYAEKFTELALDWFDRNPYPIGINYCSALEVAFRIYAWSWALSLFRDVLMGNCELLNHLLGGIWVGCRHLERNLSIYSSPNTHLLGEAFGLFACASAIPEFSEADRWRRKGEKILAEEAGKQLHGDGTHRELSSCYHLYTTDFYAQASQISRCTGHRIDGRIESAARRLGERLAELVTDRGRLPQFNDCDSGRLTWFCTDPLDAAPSLLATLPPEEANAVLTEEESRPGYHLWLQPSVDELNPPEPEQPTPGGVRRKDIESRDSGIVSHRNEAGDYLLFRSGPFGYLNCGHSHDAPTSYQLYLAGRPLVVDGGVGHYCQNLKTRNEFRSGRGKNILLLDGAGPSVTDSWFSWKHTTDATLTAALRTEQGFYCRGEHRGYRDPSGATVLVSRAITLLDAGVAVIVDRWRAEHPIEPTCRLTLHPEVAVSADDRSLKRSAAEPISYLICLFVHGAAACPQEADPAVAPAPYSPAYGSITRTLSLCWGCCRSTAGGWVAVFSRAGRVTRSDQRGEFIVGEGASRSTLGVSLGDDFPATMHSAAAS